ncbi:condensation domain-containing protein, partial [Nonomuraea lactucae]|uniref:condensation domain-containing protein n=1 Tax=Nonomuraea lactucae TaxID=2249762 RepID=UPI001F0599B5
MEVVLAGHPDVRDAVVVARDDGPSGMRLVGYVVAAEGGQPEPGGLRGFLRERLPEFMVPAAFVVVDGLPLTVNGKVDRRALPDPGVSVAGVEYVPPRTRVEVVLAEIWSQVLGVERVGVRDNFFDLGGDSILSLRIVARARAAGLPVDIADIFTHQNVGELATAVRHMPADHDPGSASQEPRADHSYWLAQLGSGFSLPVDFTGTGAETLDEVATARLDPETTTALFTWANEAYRTRPGDVLLAALLQALGRWAGTDTVTIDLEGEDRETTTACYPITLSAADLDDRPGVLKAVKERLRRAPRQGIDHADLRRLAGGQGRIREPQVLFRPIATGGSTALSSGRSGAHALRIEAERGADGGLVLQWYFSTGLHRAETIQRVAGEYVRAVRDLVEHCMSPQAGGYTPADFPLARLDQRALDTLALQPRTIADVYPLTPVQQGMLFHTLEAPAEISGVYLAQEVREFRGRLDVAALRHAWNAVTGRHAALRTAFVWENAPAPLQVVHDTAQIPFEALDWSDGDHGRLERLLADDRERGFDLTTPPLTRVTVIDRGDDRHWMVWTFHHICLDGWSVPIVLDEVFSTYEALRRHERAELPAPPPYRDFIAWLAQRDATEAERFWRRYLAGFEAATPLPVDRPATKHWNQGYHLVDFPREVTAGLARLARRARVTLGTAVQAAWALLLSRHSGEGDVVYGLTVSGRPAELSGMESMVGMFINTVPVRASVPSDVPFADWLREMQDGQIALQRFEHTPLTDIQTYSAVPRGASLFDSIIAIQNLPEEEGAGAGGLAVTGAEDVDAFLRFEQGRYPLMFSVDVADELAIAVEFSTAAFDKATVQRLFEQLGQVLAAVASDPDVLVRDVPLQPEQDLQRMLVGWNETATAQVPRATLPELFRERVRRHPDKCAVRCAGEELTYAELDRRAGRVAGLLRRHGVSVGEKVGLYFERGVDFIVALLGVARAGACYVPLDPALPESRIQYMIENSGMRAALTNVEWRVPRAVRVLHVRDGEDEPVAEGSFGEPDGLLYAMYTSGSTGVPKGVEVTHEAVARICFDPVVVVEPGDVVSHIVPISFDASTFEIWGALLNGATLAVASAREMEQLDLMSILRENGVTVSVVTSGLFHQVAEAAPEVFAGLRMLLCGGDALSI